MGDEQRKFIRVPAGTIKSCVDRLGVKASEEVYSGLAEDVSFRIRQIAENACQFMHHSKRRCLMVEDMDKAMKYSGLEPVLGYHAGLSGQYGDHVLENVASSTLSSEEKTLPNPVPMVTGSWQVVEGVTVGEEEVLQDRVELSPEEAKSHQDYLSLILQAVAGEDEDQRKIALAAVQSKPAMASILPGLTQYLQQTLANWEQLTPAQLLRVLKLALAVFTNSGLYLGPYASLLFPMLRGMLVAPGYLSCEGRVQHWHTRSMAAAALAQLLKRCPEALRQSQLELFALLQQQFSHAHQCSVPVLYGCVLLVYGLGPGSLVELLLPHLPTILAFCTTVSPTGKDTVSKLLEAIMLAAKLVLISKERAPLVPVATLAEGQAVSQQQSAPQPPPAQLLRNGAVNGGSAGGDPVPHFGGSSGVVSGVLDFTASSSSTSAAEVMDTTSAPPTSTITTTRPPSSSPPSSLYAYLEELIGEGLTLSLTVPAHSCSGGSPTPKHAPSKTTPPEPKTSSTTAKHVNRSLEKFLGGEGFKPVCIRLPTRAPPPPSVPRGYYKGREPWTFSVPQAVLPVQGNPLERGVASSQGVHGTAPTLALKGACPGLRKHRHRDHCPVDMAASWI